MTKNGNGKTKRAIDFALLAKQVNDMHIVLVGKDEESGLVKRVTVLENWKIKLVGIAIGIAFVGQLIGTAIAHIWRGSK